MSNIQKMSLNDEENQNQIESSSSASFRTQITAKVSHA
jgi:hypothetical protein